MPIRQAARSGGRPYTRPLFVFPPPVPAVFADLTADLTPALLVSCLFAAAVALHLALRLWLALRQIRAVARGWVAVPQQFAGKVPLAVY